MASWTEGRRYHTVGRAIAVVEYISSAGNMVGQVGGMRVKWDARGAAVSCDGLSDAFLFALDLATADKE